MTDPVLINLNAPGCSYRDKKTQGILVDFSFNQFGYRDRDTTADPSEVPVELFAVGDSFTLGAMVPFDSTYVHVAEADLGAALGVPVRYTNGGVSSWDLLQYLARVKEAVGRGAEVITVGVLANDFFSDLSAAGLANRERLQTTASTDTVYRELYLARRPPVERLYRSILSNSRALDLAVHLAMSSDDVYAAAYLWREGADSYLRKPLPANWVEKLEDGGRLLADMSAVARSAGATLVVIGIPQRVQVLLHGRADRFPDLDAHALFDELGELCASLGIPYIDGFEPLVAVERPTSLYYPVDGHLTPEGQERLGHFVAAELLRRGIVSAPAETLELSRAPD